MSEKKIVKFVIVSKTPLTIPEVEALRLEAIEQAMGSEEVPVLMTCGDPVTDPLSPEDMQRIRSMIDSEVAWVRISDKIANLIIAEVPDQ